MSGRPGSRPLPASVRLSEVVEQALATGRPVVALETAVVTHGLPWPRNIEALREMVAAIEAEEAVPAICLLADGCLIAGASVEQAGAAAGQKGVEKASVRDVAWCIAQGTSAGLAVSATLFLCRIAGIRVFATGGIGGAHLDYVQTGDVSADLAQLARNPVITVCSGAKSVLDIARTLEILETLAVPVVAYGTEFFPAFYLRSSGIRVPGVDAPEEVAAIALAQWELGINAGLVVGNPIPDSAAVPPAEWSGWLESAVQAATKQKVSGKNVTPFLLAYLGQTSGGRTIEANLTLLQSNARLAGQIARALAA